MLPRVGWILAAVPGIVIAGRTLPETYLRGQEQPPGHKLPVVDLSDSPAFPLPRHLESRDLAAGTMTFAEIFDAGDALFHTEFNNRDGVGGLVLPDGSKTFRFTALPPGGGVGTAISSQSCVRCHVGTASGPAQANVVGDPGDDGKPPFRVRNTTSLFGNGILQLLAQEMTEDLQAIRAEAGDAAKKQPGTRVVRQLVSKDVRYGAIAAIADPTGAVTFDVSGLEGVDPDLVVRPMGWKGHVTTVRSITVGAALALLSMQAEEVVWKLAEKGVGPDPDGDGVERELSVGDVTALVIYGTAQETPQSIDRLAKLGLVAEPSAADRAKIERGRASFDDIGCASCHVPALRLRNTVFEEPTLRGNGNYYDAFLASKDPGYDPKRPLRFDVLRDAQEPRAEAHPDGGAVVRAYGDLKRHSMGRQLSDPGGPQRPFAGDSSMVAYEGKPVLVPADEYLTPELWGVGNTGPWLHDGRAGSLREAILWHGEDEPPAAGDPGRSEAQEARDRFKGLAADDQEAILVFLRSLRTFEPPRPRAESSAASRAPGPSAAR